MEAVEILKSYIPKGELERKNFEFRTRVVSIKELGTAYSMPFRGDKMGIISKVTALVAVEINAPEDVIPLTFFQNFKASIQSARDSGPVEDWSITPLQNDQNQYIYQFVADTPYLLGGTATIKLAPVVNPNYTVTLLSASMRAIEQKALTP